MTTLLRSLLLVVVLLFAPVAWAGAVDINTATVSDLDALPGIGPAKAQAIVDHRTQNGPFARPEDIQNVTGIGPATYANIAAMITVAGGQPGAAPVAAAPAPAPAHGPAPAPAAAPAAAPATNAVNVNVAGASELQSLPGIGPSKAQAIVDDRTNNGPFATCNDLTRVTGIGPATVANLGNLCTTQ